jgi:dTDP-4-amino-4,6-dideoxygalactose transaminase
MIRVMKPKMPNISDLTPYLKQIDDLGIYSNYGPLSKLLIARLSAYFAVDEEQIVLMSNATLGLLGSISILKESGASNQILMPSWTFTASASAAVFAGCEITFEDIDSDWRVINPRSGDFALDVLPFGDSLRDPINSPLNAQWQVIDGAASFDALKESGGKIPENSILVVSMHATKLVGAGEGGICIASSRDLARELKAWSNFGFDGNRNSNRIGTNSKLSEYAAAVALASLDCWVSTREILEKQRMTALEISKTLKIPVVNSMQSGHVSPYWILKFDAPDDKDKVCNSFAKWNIESRDWWGSGCHTMEAYSSLNRSDLSNTVWASKTSLGLPFHAYLTEKDFELIFKALSEA